MRPIDKGPSPYQQIQDYSEALPHLEATIGCYCSYCEMNINHVPEVEHVFSKSRGGNETDWKNLLLACKYCNARKGTIIGDLPKDKWLWPDEDNTYLAFKYERGIPKLNEGYLRLIGDSVYNRAKKIFNDLKLDNIPSSPSDKDRRYSSRTNAYNRATESFLGWQKTKGSRYEDEFKVSICHIAVAMGFFSVWMTVFENEPAILVALINTFKGTAKNCFDDRGRAIPRQDGCL